MKQSDAVRLVGLLNGYFPSRAIPQETVALWAAEFLPFDYEDGLKVVHLAGTRSKFMPALAELLEDVREADRDRRAASVQALPAGQERFLDLAVWRDQVATPAQRQTLSRFFEGLRRRQAREGES